MPYREWLAHEGQPTADTLCDFCDLNPPVAGWTSGAQVFVCSECAERVLPALMADAAPAASYDSAKWTMARLEMWFWRAATSRLFRDRAK